MITGLDGVMPALYVQAGRKAARMGWTLGLPVAVSYHYSMPNCQSQAKVCTISFASILRGLQHPFVERCNAGRRGPALRQQST